MVWRITCIIFALVICGYAQRSAPSDPTLTISHAHGDIRVIGSDRNEIEAVLIDRITGERSAVATTGDARRNVAIDTGHDHSKGRSDLEIKVPRNAQLGPIVGGSNVIEISNITTPLDLQTANGSIRITGGARGRVQTAAGDVVIDGVAGALSIRTASGNILVKDRNRTRGTEALEIVTTSGDIRIDRTGSNVNIVGVSGRMQLECVQGNIAIRDTSSHIDIVEPGGGLDISSPAGTVTVFAPAGFTGSYRLKTLSGRLSVAIAETSGFSYRLSSFSGRIEDEFSPRTRRPIPGDPITGEYLAGKGSLNLDTFSGSISLLKRPAAVPSRCTK